MIKEQTFMSEPVQNTGSQFISEAEAVANANIGAYNYSSASIDYRNQPVQLPGWQGYSTSQQQNGFYGMPQPVYNNQQMPYYGQNVGLGANPYTYQQPMQQQRCANPAFQYMNGMNNGYGIQQQYYQQPQQDLVINIPGIGWSGEYLPTMDYQEKLEQLQVEFWKKEQEQAVYNSINGNNNFGGYNYYGNNYFGGGYGYNSVAAEASKIVNQIKEEARENRIQFDLKIANLAYSVAYGKGNYDEEKLEELYRGKQIQNPYGMTMASLNEANRFANMVPFNNANVYAAHSAAVSAEYNAVISPDSNMKECFDKMGIIAAKYAMEEEAHRRKNSSILYDSSDTGYKYFVKQKVLERYNASHGIPNTINRSTVNNVPIMNTMNAMPQQPVVNNGGGLMFKSRDDIMAERERKKQEELAKDIELKNRLLDFCPTLKECAKVEADGTITVAMNFGSNMGQAYQVDSINNENELKYDQNRERFNSFVDAIPKSIYGGGG